MANYLTDVLFLREDPFKIGVPKEPEVWAGSPEIKNGLDKMIGNMLVSEAATLDVLWGVLGTGKTYSAHYFHHKGIEEVVEELTGREVLEKGFDFFCFPNITTTIGGRRDIQFFDTLLNGVGLGLIRSKRAQEIFERAFSGDDSYVNSQIENLVLSNQFRQVLEQNIAPSSFFQSISESVLPSDPPLSLTRVPYILETFVFILKVLSHPEYGFKRVFLWIDEVEKFEQMPRVEWQINNNFLRDYVDSLLERVHVILLLTTIRREIESLKAYLDDPVQKRLTYVRELSLIFEQKDAVRYVEELLKHYRVEDAPDVVSLFPFSRKCIQKIVSGDGAYEPLTPRAINIEMQKVLASLRREAYPVKPGTPITSEKLESIVI